MIISVFLYAAIGVTIELTFNAIRMYVSKKEKDIALKGSVSIWMLPIYGLGLTYGFDMIYNIMNMLSQESYVRWLSYPIWIWIVEVLVGIPTKNRLWDYSDIKYNWNGVLSLKHYPAWVVFGIFIENLRAYTDAILINGV